MKFDKEHAMCSINCLSRQCYRVLLLTYDNAE